MHADIVLCHTTQYSMIHMHARALYIDACHLNFYVTFVFFYIVDDRPQEVYFNRHVRDQVCASSRKEIWRDLGIELLLGETVELDNIKANWGCDSRKCCSEMFKLWLERQPKASWKQLIKALKQVKLFHLAGNIERLLSSTQCDKHLELASLDEQQAPTHNVSLQPKQAFSMQWQSEELESFCLQSESASDYPSQIYNWIRPQQASSLRDRCCGAQPSSQVYPHLQIGMNACM